MAIHVAWQTIKGFSWNLTPYQLAHGYEILCEVRGTPVTIYQSTRCQAIKYSNLRQRCFEVTRTREVIKNYRRSYGVLFSVFTLE